MRHRRLLLLTALSLPCLILAQGVKPGLFEVKDVSVQASGGTVATDPGEYVLSRVLAKPGAFVSSADIARDQRELLDTGTFSDVKVLSEEVGDGAIKLIYRVIIAPRFLAPAEIRGNNAFSERKIRRLLDLTGGDRIDQARLDEKCDKVRDEYRKSYYYNVAIDADVSEPDSDGFSRVRLVIEEDLAGVGVQRHGGGQIHVADAVLRRTGQSREGHAGGQQKGSQQDAQDSARQDATPLLSVEKSADSIP